jgi:uncharacterized membrane protein
MAYLSVNVGGAFIPVILALALLVGTPLEETLLATGVMTAVSFLFSGYVIRKGVFIQRFFPALVAALLALMLDSNAAPRIAFVSGVLGILIGADLIRIPWLLLFHRDQLLVIGGAGARDAILVIPLTAVLVVLGQQLFLPFE